MNRRDVLRHAALAAGAGVFATSAKAAATSITSTTAKRKYAALIEATADCIAKGEACLAHCMEELSRGNRDMADCNRRVHDMLAICQAVLKLASYDSEHLQGILESCARACRACEEACFEHRHHWAHSMHLDCKDCYEACKACAEACESLTR